jgi:hypothetical protein
MRARAARRAATGIALVAAGTTTPVERRLSPVEVRGENPRSNDLGLIVAIAMFPTLLVPDTEHLFVIYYEQMFGANRVSTITNPYDRLSKSPK